MRRVRACTVPVEGRLRSQAVRRGLGSPRAWPRPVRPHQRAGRPAGGGRAARAGRKPAEQSWTSEQPPAPSAASRRPRTRRAVASRRPPGTVGQARRPDPVRRGAKDLAPRRPAPSPPQHSPVNSPAADDHDSDTVVPSRGVTPERAQRHVGGQTSRRKDPQHSNVPGSPSTTWTRPHDSVRTGRRSSSTPLRQCRVVAGACGLDSSSTLSASAYNSTSLQQSNCIELRVVVVVPMPRMQPNLRRAAELPLCRRRARGPGRLP